MAETITAHFGWTKPEITKSNATWGGFLNTDLDAIDLALWNVTHTNATFTGNVTVNGALSVAGGASIGGGLNAYGLTSTNGYTVSQALAGGDASFTLLNSVGANVGYLIWNHTNNAVTLGNPISGGQISINTDGSASTNGAFNAGATTVTSLSCSGATITNGFTNVNGYAVSRAPNASGDAIFALHNSANAVMGSFNWSHSNNTVYLASATGGGAIFINPDGSVLTSGAFRTGNVTAGNVTAGALTCSGLASLTGFSCVGNSTISGTLSVNGSIGATGTLSRNGVSGSNGGNQYNHWWSGSQNTLWLDNSNWGQIQTNSDYRMKKDVAPLGSTWKAVKALNPISYTHRDWTPPASVESQKKIGGSLIRSDNVERWGFLAHELQKTLVESAANGIKDDPVAVQTPNPFTVIAALTKALQEAMMRIEALEARAL